MGKHNSSCFFLRFLLVGHIAKKSLLLPPDQGFEKADGATGALVRKYLASAELEGEQELLKAQNEEIQYFTRGYGRFCNS